MEQQVDINGGLCRGRRRGVRSFALCIKIAERTVVTPGGPCLASSAEVLPAYVNDAVVEVLTT